jgi:hypothetical protein
MRSPHFDALLGMAAIGCMVLFSGCFLEAGGLWRLVYMWCLSIVVPRLWNSSHRYFAILLCPPVLLQYLLPKTIRQVILALPVKESSTTPAE